MKKLICLLMLSSTCYGVEHVTDYTYPVLDISNTRKFPPVKVVPNDYQWEDVKNDISNYIEPLPIVYKREPCKFGMDILGGCKLPVKKVTTKTKVPKSKAVPNTTRYKHL